MVCLFPSGTLFKKELTVVLALVPPLPPLIIGRDALFEAAAFLNPAETNFDVTSDARCIAAETAGELEAPCDSSDRFAKISGRDWKYLFKEKTKGGYDLSFF